MLLAAVPPLFDRVPAGLFGPLGSAFGTIHWAVLARLYQFEFEREPFEVVRDAAWDIAENELVRSAIWQERREDLLRSIEEEPASSGDDPGTTSNEAQIARSTAKRIVQRLERAGWFYFEYRSSVGHVLSFFPYAARILDVLVKVARDEQPVFQGYAHSIASLLKPESFAAKPGVALLEAKRHTLEMVRELKILNRNMFAFTQRLVDEVATAARVMEESFEKYRHAVHASYHRMKTVDNLFRFRGDILLRLESIERDRHSLDAAVRWYGEQHGTDAATANAAVKSDLDLLRMQFETMPRITDDIDARNARFSGVALRKLTYLLQQDRRVEGQLQVLVDGHTRESDPEIPFEAFKCELLGSDFLYTPPTRRPKVEAQPLARPAVPDLGRVRASLASVIKRPFARERIEKLVEDVLGARASAAIAEFPLSNDDDYVKSIFLVAYGLDQASRFVFRRNRDETKTRMEQDARGPYSRPAGEIARRGRRKRS